MIAVEKKQEQKNKKPRGDCRGVRQPRKPKAQGDCRGETSNKKTKSKMLLAWGRKTARKQQTQGDFREEK